MHDHQTARDLGSKVTSRSAHLFAGEAVKARHIWDIGLMVVANGADDSIKCLSALHLLALCICGICHIPPGPKCTLCTIMCIIRLQHTCDDMMLSACLIQDCHLLGQLQLLDGNDSFANTPVAPVVLTGPKAAFYQLIDSLCKGRVSANVHCSLPQLAGADCAKQTRAPAVGRGAMVFT